MEITDDHQRFGRVPGAVHREAHLHAVKGIGRLALHAGDEDRLARGVGQAAKLRAHLNRRHHAGRHVAAFLRLGDHAADAHDVPVDVVGIRSGSGMSADKVSGVLRRLYDALAPGVGLADPEEDGLVDAAAHRLHQAGLHLAPDVVVGVVQHRLGDRDDDGQLLGEQALLLPVLLPGLEGGLFVAGVAFDPVGHRQHVQDIDALGLAGHIGESAAGLQHGALLHHSLKDLAADGFRDQARQIVSLDHSTHVFLAISISSRFPEASGKLAHSDARHFSNETHFVGLSFEETGEYGKKK